MDLSQIVQVGKVSEKTFVVGDEHTAKHIGSGSQRVLATPWMITFMERTARDFLVECLPGGYTSVGVHVDVRHLAPSPVGSRVRVRVEVVEVDGVKVKFVVQAWDQHEEIGAGHHLRVVIDEARFLKRVDAKK
jgi:predicted thioesterase